MAKVSWQTLAVKLPSYSEAEIEQLLDDEISMYKRGAIAQRLHQRLCKLRMMRERRELSERLKK